jgi:DNA-directed RNA polymerase subunit RPC12/RpoP
MSEYAPIIVFAVIVLVIGILFAIDPAIHELPSQEPDSSTIEFRTVSGHCAYCGNFLFSTTTTKSLAKLRAQRSRPDVACPTCGGKSLIFK